MVASNGSFRKHQARLCQRQQQDMSLHHRDPSSCRCWITSAIKEALQLGDAQCRPFTAIYQQEGYP